MRGLCRVCGHLIGDDWFPVAYKPRADELASGALTIGICESCRGRVNRYRIIVSNLGVVVLRVTYWDGTIDVREIYGHDLLSEIDRAEWQWESALARRARVS